MVKRVSLVSKLQALDEISDSSVNASGGVAIAHESVELGEVLPASRSSNIEESLSKTDSSQIEQCPKQIVSETDTVQNEQSLSSVANGCCEEPTVSKTDSIQRGQYSEETLSEMDSCDAAVSESSRLVGNFTQIPNRLLRSAALFDDPTDFMIYIHLYSYSYGFNRKTADMSQSQLEQFTGVSKNCVKRSLDRLVKARWVKVVQEFERGRMARRWLVRLPEDHAPRGESKSKGVKMNTVQNGQYPKQTDQGSKTDSLKLSKLDSHKESTQIQFQKNSLSHLPVSLEKYFDELKPARKRESEWEAFETLKRDFAVEDIADCLAKVQRDGLPGGETCHSPMAFLSHAMGEVLSSVQKVRDQRQRREVEQAERRVEENRRREEAERESREAEVQERAFNRAFDGEDRQGEVVREMCRKYGFPTKTGISARLFAISAWWQDLNGTERMEITG